MFRCWLLGGLLTLCLLPQAIPQTSAEIEHWEGSIRLGARETFFRMEFPSSERGVLEILGQKIPLEANRDSVTSV
jgi:hypothetical protein